MGAKRLYALGFVSQELLILGQFQGGVLDAQRIAPQREVATDGDQLLSRDRIEADLVEEAQQPGLATKIIDGVIAIPHL